MPRARARGERPRPLAVDLARSLDDNAPMAFRYPPFAGCAALEQVARSTGSLRQGSRGPAVALVQGALLQLGEKLPRSIARLNVPDGAFGPETLKAVRSFQGRARLQVDGVVGAKTLAALDAQLAKAVPVPPPSPAPMPVLPSSPHYEPGTGDPALRHDAGAGVWGSRPWQMTYVALKASILDALPVATVVIGLDAARHMAHYLGNSGKDYRIDLEGMVRDVPSARARFEDEVAQARELVERLPVGRHAIHSRTAENGYNRQVESRNWYFAIGGYSKWGQGVATVRDGPGGRVNELDFEYRFYDRYNWDNGKSVTFAGLTVTDVFMGEFHRQGLAKEFDCHGSFRRRFTWRRGGPIPPEQLVVAGGR